MLRLLRLAAAAVVGIAAGWSTGFIRGTSVDAPRPTLEITCFCAHGDEIFHGEIASYRRLDYDVFELQGPGGAELEVRGFCNFRSIGARGRRVPLSGEGFAPMTYPAPGERR